MERLKSLQRKHSSWTPQDVASRARPQRHSDVVPPRRFQPIVVNATAVLAPICDQLECDLIDYPHGQYHSSHSGDVHLFERIERGCAMRRLDWSYPNVRVGWRTHFRTIFEARQDRPRIVPTLVRNIRIKNHGPQRSPGRQRTLVQNRQLHGRAQDKRR